MPRRNRCTSVAELTFDEVAARVIYDAGAGEFISVASGKRVGWKAVNGYMYVNIRGMPVRAHRIAWLLEHGRWPAQHIDHINGDRADNRLCNLREANDLQSVQNRGACNGRKYVGAYWNKRDKRWLAHLTHNGVIHQLGRFKTQEEAAAAYAEAALRMRGEFAWQGLHAQRMACGSDSRKSAGLGGSHEGGTDERRGIA